MIRLVVEEHLHDSVPLHSEFLLPSVKHYQFF